MSNVRTLALIGLSGLGLWVVSSSQASAQGPDYVERALTRFKAALESPAPSPESGPAGTARLSSACTFNGIKLAGKVKVVDSFPDIRVKAVSSFPDLKVKKVDSFADSCGEWQFVDSFPDFKIQFVDSFPDVEVAWVESFPGLP